jgi:hypothetical protein
MNDTVFESNPSSEPAHRKYLRKIKAKSEEPEVIIAAREKEEEIKFKMCTIFNWYSNRHDNTHAKKWIVEYAHHNSKNKKDVDLIAAADLHSNTAGWIARLFTRGIKNIPKHYEKYLTATLKVMKEEGAEVLEKQKEKLQKLQAGRNRIQQNILAKAQRQMDGCIVELEEKIDELLLNKKFKNECDFSSLVVQHGLVKDQLTAVGKHFEDRWLTELRLAHKKKDEDLVEAYSCFSSQKLRKLIEYIESIVQACQSVSEKAPDKVVHKRKPRKIKPKPAHKQVKKLFFQAKDNQYGLNSIPPEKIVGATQLWVFNTKTRYLGCYESCDSAGFFVKGSSIKNFDRKKSIEKKLRKPLDVLKNVLEGGKIVLRKLLPEIHTKQKTLTGRINKFTILMRVE